MTIQEKELEKMKDEITSGLRAVFESNMTIFDWDIPENDENSSANLIITAMQEALNELKKEVADRTYEY